MMGVSLNRLLCRQTLAVMHICDDASNEVLQ